MRITQITRPTGAALPVNTITKGGSAAKHNVQKHRCNKTQMYQKKIVKTKSYTYKDTEITRTLPEIQYIDIYLCIKVKNNGSSTYNVWKHTNTYVQKYN